MPESSTSNVTMSGLHSSIRFSAVFPSGAIPITSISASDANAPRSTLRVTAESSTMNIRAALICSQRFAMVQKRRQGCVRLFWGFSHQEQDRSSLLSTQLPYQPSFLCDSSGLPFPHLFFFKYNGKQPAQPTLQEVFFEPTQVSIRICVPCRAARGFRLPEICESIRNTGQHIK